MQAKQLVVAGTLVSTVAAAPLGCGSLDAHTGTPGTLATVQGGLSDPSGYEVHDDVRVAAVWLNVDDTGYSVSEDLPVQPLFPSSFVVRLDGPPPAAALAVPRGLDVPIAIGAVVAYEDLNGNGKLDLVSGDAGAFIDRIVGANENLYILYIGGPVPPQATQNAVGTPTPGYNLIQALSCDPQQQGTTTTGQGSSSGAGSGSGAGTEAAAPSEAGVAADEGGADPDASLAGCTPPLPEWLPMTTPYDLTVSSDPKVNQIMCQNGVSAATSSSGTGSGPWIVGTQGAPPGGYPSPTDPGLTCQGSTGYVYQHCVTVQQGVCGPSTTNCTSIQVGLGGTSTPPGWPCP